MLVTTNLIPTVDMVASSHILDEYGCTLITESSLCHRSAQSVWSIDGSASLPIQDHLDLGIKPNISTLVSHQGFIPPGISPMITTLGISPRVTLLESHQESPPLNLTKSLSLLVSHQEYLDLGISPRSSTWPLTKWLPPEVDPEPDLLVFVAKWG